MNRKRTLITDLTAGTWPQVCYRGYWSYIATVIINDDDDDDYYYYSDDVRVKLPVISLEKVLCITGFKVARAQVNF